MEFSKIPLPRDIPSRVYYNPIAREWRPLDFVYNIKPTHRCFDNEYEKDRGYYKGLVGKDIGGDTGRYIRKMKCDHLPPDHVDNYNVCSREHKLLDQIYCEYNGSEHTESILAFANNFILINTTQTNHQDIIHGGLQLYNYQTRIYERSIPSCYDTFPSAKNIFNSCGISSR